MEINPDRLRKSMEEMARIGATPGGGVNRLALSDADKQARDLFSAWVQDAGLKLSIDEMGNMFARREGENNALPPILAGSHLDSVPNGGRFDGALGTLAALEAVRSMNDADISTRRAIEVVNWTDEEGPRFPPSMLGSGVFGGAFARDWAYGARDAEGKRFGDELERIGYRGDLPCKPRPLGGYLELHVEQGPVLIHEGQNIGIVEGIYGLTWLRLTMRGVRDHAGPTPMHMRKDALVGAAKTITAIREIPGALDPDFVATVGEMTVAPNAINVIPNAVTFSVDFRHHDGDLMEKAHRMILDAAENAAKAEGLELEVVPVGSSSPFVFDPAAVAAVKRAAEKKNYTHREMWSAAGHDARYAAEHGPAAMIFVPSIGGKSHAEDELTSWEDVARGADVLAEAIFDMANSDSENRS